MYLIKSNYISFTRDTTTNRNRRLDSECGWQFISPNNIFTSLLHWLNASCVQVKAKVEWSLCYIMKISGGSTGAAALILYLEPRWKWVFSFVPFGNRSWYPMRRWQGDPYHSGLNGVKKNAMFLRRIEPRSLGHWACSLFTLPNNLSHEEHQRGNERSTE